MYLLIFVFGLTIGFWCCHMWGNLRATYWKKQLQRVVVKADAVNAANVQLIEVAKRVEKYERGENIEKMRIGLTKAIVQMSEESSHV